MGNVIDTEGYRPSTDKPLKAYCGIDVGSVSCGYAYSFEDTDHIWINENWASHLSHFSYRTPSAILYKSGSPVSFGHEACEWFTNKTRETVEDADQYEFFYDGLIDSTSCYTKKHKISDIEEDVLDETPITDKDQKYERLHPTVMQHRADLAVLLSQHCSQQMDNKYKIWEITPVETIWTFVVPFSWNIEEKKIFREMLIKSFQQKHTNQSYKIHIVTSTEALWVSLGECDIQEKAVMLVHAGGDRIEISVHRDKHSTVPIGTTFLNVGGNYINNIFESHLCKSLGPMGDVFLKEFKEQYKAEWMEFLFKFESAKTAFCFERSDDLCVDIHYDFMEAFFKLTGKDIKEIFEEMSHSSDKTQLLLSSMEKLVLNVNFIKWLHEHLCYLLTTAITQVKKKVNQVNIGALILTGGLGTSSYIRGYLDDGQAQAEIGQMKVGTPENAATLVTEGAVVMSKNRAELRQTFALIYAGSAFERSGKGINTVYPVFSSGQEIQVGQCFHFGPIVLDVYFDKYICFEIWKVKKQMEVLTNGRFYLLSGLGDSSAIGTIKLDLPEHEFKKRHTIFIDVIMDATSFKTTMMLESSNPRRKISVTCAYGKECTTV